jgi:hypothetical protein
MATSINLLKTDENKVIKRKAPAKKRRIINSSVVLLVLLLIATSGVYAYKLVLAKEIDVLDSSIKKQKDIIATYKEVEQRKSLLTLKTNEIQEIFSAKFDYLKAIEDAQQLFGFSITIESIDIDKEGTVSITARKEQEITLSQDKAFSTNIKELNLSVIVPSSFELEDTIDTLLSFEGQGLASVVVTSTQLTDDGEYQVDFSITFASTSNDALDDFAEESLDGPDSSVDQSEQGL